MRAQEKTCLGCGMLDCLRSPGWDSRSDEASQLPPWGHHHTSVNDNIWAEPAHTRVGGFTCACAGMRV